MGKHRKYCKSRSIGNKPRKYTNRYKTLYTDGNNEATENPSNSYTSSSEQTLDNKPKQVRSIINTKKRLKNKRTITVDQETNRNLTKTISNQWFQPIQDNNSNPNISQPP